MKLETKIKQKDLELSILNASRLGIDEKSKHATRKLLNANENYAKLEEQLKTMKHELKQLQQEASQVQRAFATFENDVNSKTELAGVHFNQETQKEYASM